MKKMLIALSLSGALLGGSVAWAEETVTAATTAENVAVVETTDTSLTTNSELAVAPAPAATPVEQEVKLDTGDTAWILVSTALVLLMTIPA